MRYETGVLLGEGASGRVFRAVDSVLGRPVALKFLRNDDPHQVERFFREARAQSQVEHPLVCKVYEVGELHGRPFIAMQLIDGLPLRAIAPSMNLEQKARVVRDVAGAVHAAHALGLVHRDLKPGNILVEVENGEQRPYLTDFGLVRQPGEDRLTASGDALGTPPYMAPEQARGDSSIDRRTDVYGLGAVLYELLVGEPPFSGAGAVDVLVKVLRDEPVPPRKRDPRIPKALETIALKCLEKEPQHRYASARELSDDLDHYLRGEPLTAQPPSTLRLAVRLLRRNRVAAGFSAAAVVLGVTLLGMTVFASRQARIAQAFGQMVERVEVTLRQAYLLPLHDIRPDKQRVREQIAGVLKQMRGLTGTAATAGHYALGRGHLALREYQAARTELEQSAAREPSPEVSYALGATLGALYQRALDDANRVSDPKRRQERIREVEVALKEPALRALQGIEGYGDSQYVTALIAFYEHRDESALAAADATFQAEPGRYDAKRLEADVHIRRAKELLAKGDVTGEVTETNLAVRAITTAIEIGRSDPTVYQDECEIWAQLINDAKATGFAAEDAFNRAKTACDRANLADSEDAETAGKLARINLRWAIYRQAHGQDPLEWINQSIAWGQKAVGLDPSRGIAFYDLGGVYSQLGVYQQTHGQDPRPALARATDAFVKTLELSPYHWNAYTYLGLTWKRRGLYESDHGVDPAPSWSRALEYYEKMNGLTGGTDSTLLANLATLNGTWAEAEIKRGIDPRTHVDRAIAISRQSLERDPGLIVIHANIGADFLVRAEYERRLGLDPLPSAAAAIAEINEDLEKDPKRPSSWLVLGDRSATPG